MEKILAYSRPHLSSLTNLAICRLQRNKQTFSSSLYPSGYEKGSIILTSNYNFDDWGNIFEDNVVATAIIDRLVHHAAIFYINGANYRLKDKIKKARSLK